MAEGQESWGRDRREAVASADLNPVSLVGSYFHRLEHDEIVWQGIVVGEPANGYYLLELEDSVPGASRHQRLFSIRQLADDGEWRFYDTSDHWRGAYAEWIAHTKENA